MRTPRVLFQAQPDAIQRLQHDLKRVRDALHGAPLQLQQNCELIVLVAPVVAFDDELRARGRQVVQDFLASVQDVVQIVLYVDGELKHLRLLQLLNVDVLGLIAKLSRAVPDQ